MKDFLLKLNAVVNLTRLLYIFLRSLDSSPIFVNGFFTVAVNDHAHMIGSHHQSQVTSYCQSSVLSPVRVN